LEGEVEMVKLERITEDNLDEVLQEMYWDGIEDFHKDCGIVDIAGAYVMRDEPECPELDFETPDGARPEMVKILSIVGDRVYLEDAEAFVYGDCAFMDEGEYLDLVT
jgi:hypothetical protein